MGLIRVDGPATEPVTLAEAKAQLRLEHNDDDALIDGLIVAAREYAEAVTRRALITQTWKLTLDAFCAKIDLPKPPFQSVASVKYLDTGGVERTLDPAAYDAVFDTTEAFVMPAYGTSWPSTRDQAGAVRIAFVAGYENANEVPQAIKQGMLIHLTQLYEDREGGGTIPPAVDVLYWPYRVVTF